jgi:ribosome modulation factor
MDNDNELVERLSALERERDELRAKAEDLQRRLDHWDRVDSAYTEARRACMAGAKKEDCPYPKEDDRNLTWALGYAEERHLREVTVQLGDLWKERFEIQEALCGLSFFLESLLRRFADEPGKAETLGIAEQARKIVELITWKLDD